MFRKIRAYFKNRKDDKERFGNVTERPVSTKEKGFFISFLLFLIFIYISMMVGLLVANLTNGLAKALLNSQPLTLDLWNQNMIPVFSNFKEQYLQLRNPIDLWNLGANTNIASFSLFIGLAVLGGLYLLIKTTSFSLFESKKINKKQLGNNRFMSDSEVMRNYEAIPDRDVPFEGSGGIAISHMPWYKVLFNFNLISFSFIQRLKVIANMFRKVWGVYFIDTDFVNDLIIGITRSGKGEMFVFSIIDILSRALSKTSMVVNDMKGELTRASYNILKKRGYDVEVLNLDNLNKSMSYNPLTVAIDLAKNRKYDDAQKEINSISYSIFYDEKENNKYWQNSAMNLFNAIALAQILLALKESKTNKNAYEKITIYNITDMLSTLGGQETLYKMGSQVVKKNKLVEFFESLDDLEGIEEFEQLKDLAVLQFSTSKFAGEEAQGNTFSTAMTGLKIYQQSDVAKMTSKNSVDLRKLGFPRNIYFKSDNDKYSFETISVEIENKNNSSTKKQAWLNRVANSLIRSKKESMKIMLDINGNGVIDLKMLLSDQALMTVTTRKEVLHYELKKEYKYDEHGKPVLDKWTKKSVIQGITVENMDDKTSPFDINIDYSEKPVAIFLITPAYDSAYNQIVSFFINQSFSILGQACQSSIGGKCYTPVCYLLDEMTNLPAITDMKTKISICLGMRIKFVNIVQNLEQMITNYGKDVADTIKSNSGNTIYIFSNSVSTTEEISKRLGKRTIYVASTQEKNSTKNGRVTNNLKEQDLLTPQQLSKFKNNENLVLTDMKRRDKQGYDIVQRPILNIKRKKMPYRYQLLGDTFNTDVSIFDIDIDTPHLNLNLANNRFDYSEVVDIENHSKANKQSENTPLINSDNENEEEKEKSNFWDNALLTNDVSDDDLLQEDIKNENEIYFSDNERKSVDLISILFERLNQTEAVAEIEFPSLNSISDFKNISKEEMNFLLEEVNENEEYRKTMIENDLEEKNIHFRLEERGA